MIPPRVEMMAAIAATLLVAAGAAALALAGQPVESPGVPVCRLAPVTVTSASLPPLGDLARFDVNDADPFMPQRVRLARFHGPDSGHGNGGGGVAALDPLRPDRPIPELALPTAAPAVHAFFACVGVVAAHGGQSLLVRRPDGLTAALRVGEGMPLADGRWVLEALEPGGVARFRDPAGSPLRLAVGGTADIVSGRRL